jgi:nucleotide-binding universal stress UspA family protein
VIGTIVVGTDGSETAESAVQRAGDLAKATGATLHVVSAHDGAVPPDLTTALLDRSSGALHVRGIECQAHARRGDPAEALLDVADEERADVIVVGSKGMHGGRRFLLGSVPDKVSHHASCSVLIVRTT